MLSIFLILCAIAIWPERMAANWVYSMSVQSKLDQQACTPGMPSYKGSGCHQWGFTQYVRLSRSCDVLSRRKNGVSLAPLLDCALKESKFHKPLFAAVVYG